MRVWVKLAWAFLMLPTLRRKLWIKHVKYFVFICVQVFSMFLETLVDFIIIHKDDLQDWLFVLLTQLLKKMGADLLGSVQAKVQKALDVTRWVLRGSAMLWQVSSVISWHCLLLLMGFVTHSNLFSLAQFSCSLVNTSPNSSVDEIPKFSLIWHCILWMPQIYVKTNVKLWELIIFLVYNIHRECLEY